MNMTAESMDPISRPSVEVSNVYLVIAKKEIYSRQTESYDKLPYQLTGQPLSPLPIVSSDVIRNLIRAVVNVQTHENTTCCLVS